MGSPVRLEVLIIEQKNGWGEEGTSNITVIKLKEICDSLDISMNEFFNEDEEPSIFERMSILKKINRLSTRQQQLLLDFIDSLFE